MPTPEAFSHCHHCGAAYAARAWPRRCESCERMTYRNPLPVAVALVPVGAGLLVIQRDIEPRRGELALPGGYIEHGEDWRDACARELQEETGLGTDPAAVTIRQVESAPDGTLLVFGRCAPADPDVVAALVPRPEVQALRVITEPCPMAFPLHEKVVQDWFTGGDRRRLGAGAATARPAGSTR